MRGRRRRDVEPVRSIPVRIEEATLARVKCACGYSNEPVGTYISRIALQRANYDIKEFHKSMFNNDSIEILPPDVAAEIK